MIIDKVITSIESGRIGGNEGLFMGYPRLQEMVPGVQKGTIYDIAGNTGSGKTAFALASFVLNPYDHYLKQREAGVDIQLEILLWSMEMSADILITKAMARKIFKDYHILTDVNMILSRGKNRISQEIFDLVLKTRKYFEEFESVVSIFTSANPTGIHKQIKARALANGKEFFKDLEITEDGQPKIVKQFSHYVPNHPNHYLICLQDHIALQKSESQITTVKGLIDKLTNYIIDDKLRYGITNIMCQQVNRASESIDRLKAGSIDVQLGDTRDSADVVHASDYVIGITNPFQYEMTSYRGYDISRLKDRFRSVKIVKARDGMSNVVIGMAFLGEGGLFMELPIAKEMTETDYLRILNIKKYGTS
jgi:hypothetical protein